MNNDGRFKKGSVSYWKGKHLSNDTRKKLSLSLKGRKAWNKGLTHSKETREKISVAVKKTNVKYWKGKTFSEAHKQNLSKSHLGICLREKSPLWRGGTSYGAYSTDWTQTLKRSIRERDNYICQLCSQYGNDVHHIDYNKKNCDVNNLITLCIPCHRKTNHNRHYWEQYILNHIKGRKEV